MFRPDLIGHLQGDFFNECSICFKSAITHYRNLPEHVLLSQDDTYLRTNQQINNRVQQVGIDSLWISPTHYCFCP